MSGEKTSLVRVRVSEEEKECWERAAEEWGGSLSGWVRETLSERAGRGPVAELVRGLVGEEGHVGWAKLADVLLALEEGRFAAAVEDVDVSFLDRYEANYVAAMVEEAAMMKGCAVPKWTKEIVPLATPHFATTLPRLRLIALRDSPAQYRARNVFVSHGIVGRV